MAEEIERKQSRLYTTEIINQLREDMAMGFVTDKEPFYPFDSDLRNANVTFKMTEEECDEYLKCFNDANYFIEKYCKFMTDAGRRTIKLRDYQRETVDTITSEHLDETIGDEGGEFVPDNRVIMLMWARQCSKCVNPLTKIELDNGKNVDISSLSKKCGGFLYKIKKALLKIYSKL